MYLHGSIHILSVIPSASAKEFTSKVLNAFHLASQLMHTGLYFCFLLLVPDVSGEVNQSQKETGCWAW